ncbi:hypothetical protein ACU686_17790 [Yinghuangia aomiensis]
MLTAGGSGRRRGLGRGGRRGGGEAGGEPRQGFFYVDTLEYLRRGGRIGAAAARWARRSR